MDVRIETERLILRRPKREDVGSLLRLVSDPTFASTVPEIPGNEDEVREYLKAECSVHRPELNKCFNLLIERRQDSMVVGLVTLILRKHSQGQIGYALHTSDRGCGYASEASRALVEHAFTHLGLHRIYADTRADNKASWKVMERLGMVREARFRETVKVGGGWRDLVVYAVLAQDWPTAQKATGLDTS
jgi:RimJ/RimL family protein N-acetyltransferase